MTMNAAMKPSSIAIRAWTKTVKFSAVTTAPTLAVRTRPNNSHRIANTPMTTALAAIVDSARQPSGPSPTTL